MKNNKYKVEKTSYNFEAFKADYIWTVVYSSVIIALCASKDDAEKIVVALNKQ